MSADVSMNSTENAKEAKENAPDESKAGSEKPASRPSLSSEKTTYPNGMTLEELTKRAEELCITILPQLRLDAALPPPRTKAPPHKLARLVKKARARSHSVRLNSSKKNKVTVEKMFTGGFNHVLSITQRETRLVLRIPRTDWTWPKPAPERDVAVLHYVRAHSSIPVPEIRAYNFTNESPLGTPYLLLSRVPGIDLSEFMATSYTTEEWVSIGRQLGTIMRQMQAIEYPHSGRIESNLSQGKPEEFIVRPFEVCYWGEFTEDGRILRFEDGKCWNQKEVATNYRDTLFFLKYQFGRWWANELLVCPLKVDWGETIFEELSDMASEMAQEGVFEDMKTCLCHGDLLPRNIMVERRPCNDGEGTEVKITGILDWDLATFMPAFYGCAAPYWLWADEDYIEQGEDPELKAALEPAKEIDRRVKEAWVEAVGEDYALYTFEKPYLLARRLVYFALHGADSQCEKDAARELIKEWNDFLKSENSESGLGSEKGTTGDDTDEAVSAVDEQSPTPNWGDTSHYGILPQ